MAAKKDKKNVDTTTVKKTEDTFEWINPLGGLGDTLMLSGVLKLVHDRFPERKFKLIARTKYWHLLQGHPAIVEQGHPPVGTKYISNAYWLEEPLGPGNQRAFQILARTFGLPTPIEEKLYLPETTTAAEEEANILIKTIPWKKKNILIAPGSDSPRKMAPPMFWHYLVQRLSNDETLVLQSGRMFEMHIKGACSLLGTTTPRELIAIAKKCDVIVTSDNFVMHVAHLLNKPAVVLWGPTSPEVYGYKEQIHFQAPLDHCPERENCIGPHVPDNYSLPCPLGPEHCMSKFNLEDIYFAVKDLL